MKKILLTLAVAFTTLLATAQTNQYFWYNGNILFGTAISQTDSLTFGINAAADTLHLLMPRTIIHTIHDTVSVPYAVHDTISVPYAVHDTVFVNNPDGNNSTIPEGALSGLFSVSPTKKVRFSKGNLQYQASTDTWRFAENQWDIVGDSVNGTVYENGIKCDNALISNNYTGWIDLFGYGTGNNPYLSTTNIADYSIFTDWGVNPISNGGNSANQWRTLTDEEMVYLMEYRPNANALAAKATVNGVRGLIILPNDFIIPSSLSWNVSDGYEWTEAWQNNTYTYSQWSQMENAGAVFFPCEGIREGKLKFTHIDTEQYEGFYWVHFSSYYEYGLCFADYFLEPSQIINIFYSRHLGLSVRLVQDANETPTTICVPDTIFIPQTQYDTITIIQHDTIYIDKDDTDCPVINRTISNDTITKGENYHGGLYRPWWNMKDLEEGTYRFTDTLKNIYGCDSIIILNLVVSPTISSFPEGALSGEFSVSATKKVRFSKGNLQYQASTDTWRFAENQWDIVGEDNKYISNTYSGWIDLFGWGTGNNPTNISANSNDYEIFIDWGANEISNGGRRANEWRTLSYDEWDYLFYTRQNANNLRSLATVCGVYGYIILPDDFSLPANLSWSARQQMYSTNIYDANQWAQLYEKGAIFLPAYNYSRYGNNFYIDENWWSGWYWSTTELNDAWPDNNCCAWCIFFYQDGGPDGLSHSNRQSGLPVRLVQEIK